MNNENIYDTKRQNFIANTKRYFDFLVQDMGYSAPIHIESVQSNGAVIRDTFEYRNPISDSLITILNAYHPVDYGFEIHLGDTKGGDSEMIEFILKEDQDLEQTYIVDAATRLRDLLVSKENTQASPDHSSK